MISLHKNEIWELQVRFESLEASSSYTEMTPSLFDFSESGFLCHQVQLVEIVEGGKTKKSSCVTNLWRYEYIIDMNLFYKIYH